MVQHLGLGYSVGYTGALRTVGAAGKTQTLSLLSSVTARDREAFLEHFADDAQVQCPLRGSRFMESPSSFWSTLQDANVGFAVLDKTIAAGRTVSLRVRLWAHGWSRESVLLVSYAPEGLRIQRLRCFL
jgi:hypothetical protein